VVCLLGKGKIFDGIVKSPGPEKKGGVLNLERILERQEEANECKREPESAPASAPAIFSKAISQDQ